MILKQTPVYILILFCLGCTPSTTYINRDADKEDAVRITEKFYDLMKQKDYHNIFHLWSVGNRGFTVEQRNQLLTEHFNNIQGRLGSIESVDLISCETKRVEGERPSGEYLVTFDVSRSIKQSNREEFRLLLEGTEMKIADYNINKN
jgi:hypothetical protein